MIRLAGTWAKSYCAYWVSQVSALPPKAQPCLIRHLSSDSDWPTGSSEVRLSTKAATTEVRAVLAQVAVPCGTADRPGVSEPTAPRRAMRAPNLGGAFYKAGRRLQVLRSAVCVGVGLGVDLGRAALLAPHYECHTSARCSQKPVRRNRARTTLSVAGLQAL